MPKLIHLGSFATKFDDKIIKNLSFQKMVPNVVPGSPFSTPPGTTTGPNFFLMPKLVHLGSTGNKFDDKLIKNRNFQKMVPNVVPGTPFRTPPGTPTGPNVLLIPKFIQIYSSRLICNQF